MEKLFVPYQLAKQLKEKGFNEFCLAKWMLDIKGDIIPHFRFNYEKEGLWAQHNSKDTSGLNGNNGKDFLWSAPMYQQVLDWFREKHNLHIEVYIGSDDKKIWWNVSLCKVRLGFDHDPINEESIGGDTYYESLNKTIEETLKLI